MKAADGDESPLLDVDWQNHTDTDISRPAITRHLNLILQRLGSVDTVKIEIIVVGDKAIQQLNHKFRQVDQPTDVLSFPNDPDLNPELLGSVAVSVDTAERQAKEAGINLEDEVKMLAGHGLLHLLGYHHA